MMKGIFKNNEVFYFGDDLYYASSEIMYTFRPNKKHNNKEKGKIMINYIFHTDDKQHTHWDMATAFRQCEFDVLTIEEKQVHELINTHIGENFRIDTLRTIVAEGFECPESFNAHCLRQYFKLILRYHCNQMGSLIFFPQFEVLRSAWFFEPLPLYPEIEDILKIDTDFPNFDAIDFFIGIDENGKIELHLTTQIRYSDQVANSYH